MRAVQTPVIPTVAELIRQNPGTISLGQGVVHYGPPQQAIEQIALFQQDPQNHKYRPVHGIPELIETIEAKLERENGIRVGPERRVVVTAGGNMAFQNAIHAITDPGDEIIFNTPYYFNHEMAVVIAGARPVLVPTDADYLPRPEAIRAAITPRTRAITTISPNNPTGAVYPEDLLREINAICRERGIYHIHDEAYEYFTYDGARHFSPGSIPASEPYTISLFSLSKAYGFASWRIGYMVIPERLFEPIRKIQDTLLICPPVISQYAAVGALQAGQAWAREHIRSIAEVRELAVREMEPLLDRCVIPRAPGAFYFLLRARTEIEAMRVVERLIREHRVAVIPGDTFGAVDGCYLRVAYGALQKETVTEGLGRFVTGLASILGETE